MYRVRIHGAPNAKARVMIGNLLKYKDYEKLMSFDSTKKFIDYLYNHTHYKKALKENNYNIEKTEISIKKYFIKSLEKLYYFYFDEYRDFFKALLMRYEVEDIKIFLRVFTREESKAVGQEHYIYSDLFKNISYDKIKKANTLDEFMRSLEDTIYYKELIKYRDEDKDKMLFYMEMALDRIYFIKLYKTTLKLKKNDKEKILEMLGINVDLLNIQWIYRGRKYFNISSEELFNLSLDMGHKYDLGKIKQFCYMSLEDFLKYISSSNYSEIFEAEEYLMELSYERYLYNMLNDYIKITGLSITVPVVYIFRIEYEMRDLFSILEGIKYGVKNIEKFLVINIDRGEKIGG
ncbi:MAG: V-type ATPase subunit [bacterium]